MSTTPYMNLTLPTVSVTLGPTYATENNTAFTTVDSHDHTSGQGVPVPSGGINVDADLPFNGFNSTLLRSSRYDPQGSALGLVTDIGCLYVSGVDLWFNDVDGNQIQLTASGALNAASIGGIGGDYTTSTASVAYSSATKTFTFLQDTNKSALMDMGTILLRRVDNTSSAAITIKPSTSLSAGYTLTLPQALPGATTFVGVDSSGNLAYTNSFVSLALSAGLTIGTTLDVTGATTVTTITASGAATFQSTVDVTGAATFNGAVTLGDAAGDAVTVNGTISSNLLPTDATYTLGNSTHDFTRLFLDNGATDGGAINFNAGTTSFLKSNAAGTVLSLGGFTDSSPSTSAGATLGATQPWGTLKVGTALGSGTPVANTLYKDLVPRAWFNTVTSTGVNLTVNHSGTGIYEYTFKTAMADSSYAVVATAYIVTPGSNSRICSLASVTSAGFTVDVFTSANALTNAEHCVVVFGNA